MIHLNKFPPINSNSPTKDAVFCNPIRNSILKELALEGS